MTAQLSIAPSWAKPPILERDRIPDSLLRSARLRKNLDDSRKAFLNLADETDKLPPPPDKKPHAKKISFKIKKTSSIYRRKDKISLSSNNVQELAKKYNELVERTSLSEQPKIAKLVKRVNSQRILGDEKVLRKPSVKLKPSEKKPKMESDTQVSVKAAIAIFEQKSNDVKLQVPKPKVPEKTFDAKSLALRNQEKRLKIFEKRVMLNNEQKEEKTEGEAVIEVVNIPLIPPKKCDSRYETMLIKRIKTKDADIYDVVQPNPEPYQPPVPPRRPTILKLPPKPPVVPPEKIYEELQIQQNTDEDDGYEICETPTEENIYETLLARKKLTSLKRQEEPLPTPPRSSPLAEDDTNFYESIYCKRDEDTESTYESICGCTMDDGDDGRWPSKRDSIISDQQSNSLYGRSITSWAEDVLNTYISKSGSELSGSSDRSDEWVDLSDHEENSKNVGFVIVRERQKLGKKTSGWSQQLREQWSKIPRSIPVDQGDSDSDHVYETLSSDQPEVVAQEVQDDDFDSFDSDSESDNSFAKNDSGVDMGNTQLPEPPNQQPYVFTRLAVSAGKHMKRLRRNWSLTKNDITKSLSRMTKRKSRTDLDSFDKTMKSGDSEASQYSSNVHRDSYQNIHVASQDNLADVSGEKTKSLGRKGFLNKFRRSMSVSGESLEGSLNPDNKPKSTFYLTDTIDVDRREEKRDGVPVSLVKSKTSPVRPSIPPPPTPVQISPNIEMRKVKEKRSTSWYAECGLFKNSDQACNLPKRPNTFWYAEVGLYRSNASTPSTSSTENSGSLTNVVIKTPNIHTINQDDNEEYYNMKNENDYYNESIKSSDSCDTKKDEAFNSLSNEMQLRLQDEPLYQFYDAAVLESVCHDGTSEYDYEGYEEVGHKKNVEIRLTTRPTAMELVTPRNSVSVARTLWCEIPEVLQSTVLSTLSLHQKKLQEAKFEMLTSEASYLNSLNVLTDHFIKKLIASDCISKDEKDILFDKINPVKECSEKLLTDLEHCWQDNILLHGICDIIKKHAEENFYVHVTYCENQILIDRTLKKLKDRVSFIDVLKQLESSTVCHLLTLHSFLMLPMQRITRWPLLVDAVLKRLSPQDEEYLSCQYALATLNKIVNQCNEGARRMERVTEMQKLASQMEFSRGVPPISLVTGSRWLVRSGPLTQMQARGDDIKLTFGKRFTKVPLHLFLFNDILIVAKSKGDDNYAINHYCYRSYLEINSETLSCLPFKDTQGRHLIFLTILENHEEKTIELLLSCNSETDKERWLEALSPPKSENPDETLYECWDCPQVTSIHNYMANQPDELALSRGDIINVTRKMADGWYHGERIRDGETGWFPANYTVEVANPHVRARNLKQRYRLLAFSENYLKSK